MPSEIDVSLDTICDRERFWKFAVKQTLQRGGAISYPSYVLLGKVFLILSDH